MIGLRMNLTIAPLDAIVFKQAFLEGTVAKTTSGFSVYCLMRGAKLKGNDATKAIGGQR